MTDMDRAADLEKTPGSIRMPALLAAVTVGLSLLCVVSPSAGEQLLLGWLYFPFRVLPQVTVDFPTVLLGLVCAIAMILVAHLTLRWLVRSRPVGPQPRWTMRGTLIVTSLILLLFVAGVAMVGASHQTVWLMTGSRHRASQATPVSGMIQHFESDTARIRQSRDLRQIGFAVLSVEETCKVLPYGGAVDDQGRQLHGWIVLAAPYMIYSHAGIDFSKPWNAPPNDRLFRCALPEVLHPSIPDVFDENGYGLSHIAGNVNVLPIITLRRGESAEPYDLLRPNRDGERSEFPALVSTDDIRDGASNTILAGEVVSNLKPWGSPANVRDPALGVNRSPHGFGCLPGEDGALFVMCDGSVRTLAADVDTDVMRALATPAGEEPISSDF